MDGDDSCTEYDSIRRTEAEESDSASDSASEEVGGSLPNGDAGLPPVEDEAEEKDIERQSNGLFRSESAVRFVCEKDEENDDGKRSKKAFKARDAEIDEGQAFLDAMRVKRSEERTNRGLAEIPPLAVGESSSETSSSDEAPVPFLPKSIHDEVPDEKLPIDVRDYYSPRPIGGRIVYVDHWGRQKVPDKGGKESKVASDGEKNVLGEDDEDNTPAARRRLRARQAMHDKPW